MKRIGRLVLWFAALGFASGMATAARAQHSVGNGGGYSEGLVLIALRAFDRGAAICEQASDGLCSLDESERQALQLMRAMLPSVAQDPNYLAFVSEADDPVTFPPGERRAFWTDPTPGAPVLINRSLLYLPTGAGSDVPVTLGDAFSLIAQILAFQNGVLNPAAAAVFGQKVSVVQRSQELEFGKATDPIRISNPSNRLRYLRLSLDGPDDGTQFSSVFLQDSERLFDVSDELRAGVPCAAGHAEKVSLGRMTVETATMDLGALTLKTKVDARYLCAGDAVLHGAHLRLVAHFDELHVDHPRGPNDRAFRLAPSSFGVEVLP